MIDMKELTYPELLSLPANSYTLLDVRDDVRVRYGTIPGSIHIQEDELKEAKIWLFQENMRFYL